MRRRAFLEKATLGTAAVTGLPLWYSRAGAVDHVPHYMADYEDLYNKDPKKAALEWFEDANFGLFMHYGLYSILGKGEWVQYHQKISVLEYEKLKERFTPNGFDAEKIANLAVEAEMKYINITTRHHDGFCLFNTKATDFNSVKSPARRDLVEELANACTKRNLGLCLYYSHGRDWRHPHAPNNDRWGGKARPEYEEQEPYYKYGDEHDLNKYIDFMHEQFVELLTQYGPIASMWLDGYGVPMNGPTEEFRIPESYELIRSLQPHCLISAKWGYNGMEDYNAPEYHWLDKERFKKRAEQTIRDPKPMELCTHIAGWGYVKKNDGKHRREDSVWENIEYAANHNANLLLNIAPLPDGSIDQQDLATLRAIGEKIRRQGWPATK